MQDLYGVAWFRNFAVKTKAYAAIASTDTTARDKFKDDIFEAVIATGFLCNCDRTRTASLMLDLQTNYCREVDYYPKTVSKAQDMLKIHMDVIKNPGVNLYQGKDQPNKGKATVPGASPATSIITGGTSSVAGSVNTPLRLTGTTGNQMMQVPLGMQLMQIPTQGGGTVVKTGYFDTSNVFHDAIKGKDENGNAVYLIPCPTGTTNVELQSDWHYASKNEDLPHLATEADQGMQFIQSRRIERDPFGLLDHVIMDSGCTNTTICNGELMHGLRQAEKELDMHTNVGSRVLDEEGFLGRFPPPVYYDEDRIANVLAMREMIAAGYRITMDTDFDNAFVVHCDGDRQMRFEARIVILSKRALLDS
ncbi:unnamed protein product [Cylindrotheca closterium]|uniref:Uncharacterized protein n=1 Tax=Cylindrotheca closterium TaxID=2856 RepID=A0AAD2FGB5_9STRA|nr:unnamed protein product [Cylindrotheca closterium]